MLQDECGIAGYSKNSGSKWLLETPYLTASIANLHPQMLFTPDRKWLKSRLIMRNGLLCLRDWLDVHCPDSQARQNYCDRHLLGDVPREVKDFLHRAITRRAGRSSGTAYCRTGECKTYSWVFDQSQAFQEQDAVSKWLLETISDTPLGELTEIVRMRNVAPLAIAW